MSKSAPRSKAKTNKIRTKVKVKAKAKKPSTKAAPKTKPTAKNESIERIKRLIRSQGEALLNRPNVTSVAIGFKKTDGQQTATPSLQFTVDRKLSPEALLVEAIPAIPAEIVFEGVKIPTDVLQRKFKPSFEVVKLKAKPIRKTWQDPIQGGISVGHFLSTAGTLGAIVRDAASGAPLILSNWHVLCGAQGKPGDAIVQPGPFDDDRVAQNEVGKLLRSHLGVAGDCAIASIQSRKTNATMLELGCEVASVGKPALGDMVVKSGRTTGVTYGVVSRVEGLFKVPYEGIGDQSIGGFEIEATPKHKAELNEISKGGDSGSAWMAVTPGAGRAADTVTNTMLGLHFGGDAEGSEGEFALACYAHSVFEKLEIVPFTDQPTNEAAAAPQAVQRSGFATDFLGFTVPLPSFDGKVKKDLIGLNGTKQIDYCHFTVWLSKTHKLPLCVAWNIDGGRKKSLSRKGISFTKDTREDLEDYQVGDEVYANNDLDRGHVARRDDLVWGTAGEAKQANIDSFFFTNMTPQHQAFNQSKLKGKWGLLENAILDDVVLRDLRVSVMGGPIFSAGDIAYRGIKIPREFWKVVFFTDDEDGEDKARGFILTQKDLVKNISPEALELEEFRWYQVPLAKIGTRTGVRFAADLNKIDTKFPEGVGGTQARLVDAGQFFTR